MDEIVLFLIHIKQIGKREYGGSIEAFGSIDILFSNAGIAAYGNSHELEEEQWDAVIDTNLKGGWLRHIMP